MTPVKSSLTWSTRPLFGAVVNPAAPRTGARRRADVPPEILARLNRGEIESVTLAEALSINFADLLHAFAPRMPRSALDEMRAAAALGVTQRMALAGRLLLEHFGPTAYGLLATHRSDTLRGWAAYLLAAMGDLTLPERLLLVRPLANDLNAGVREWAWVALRPQLAADIEYSIDLLTAWTASDSHCLRRFTSEATRPRGVWCAHIGRLKRTPALGLPILEPLRADPHKYVQDSVSNWLNDASKSQPAWVRALCARWRRESRAPATERICRRALRSLKA